MTRLRALARAGWLPLALASWITACGLSQPSFDPSGPCTTDGRTPGAYPDLEARLLPSIVGTGPGGQPNVVLPTTVDSGRSCSAKALSTLASHGLSELRFAGATWDQGGGDGTVSAFFTTPPGQPALQAAWMEEFYETGARASTKTENITITRPTIGPAGEVFRLDTINDLSYQTIVVWPATDGVRVVILATRVDPNASKPAHDAAVELAVTQSATLAQP